MNPDSGDQASKAALVVDRPERHANDADDNGTAAVADTDEQPVDDAPRRRNPRQLLRAVIALVAVAAAAALMMLSLSEYQHRQGEALRAQAVAVSHDYLVAMAAFDYQNLDANRDHITANSTPEFAAKYDEMVKALRDIVVTSKGVSTATADHVTVDRIDGNAATIVAFVDQRVTNVTAPHGSEQKYRMVVTLVRGADRWIVNDVHTV